ncbi:MAG: alpha/beta hydrolase [Rhodospirillales bacterium]|jgi:pimeloyl-ACP methyl ester carboxylesterase|nr:alpha/beta hydrolase [Rhodospirillales bacterium]MDP6883090.1 alpha/beta hydrolase [Rhodospirillales bacterium]
MTDETTPAEPAPERLPRDGRATIAYHASPGKSPGVVFLGGFRSDMTGSKAIALEAWCRRRGQAFVRFDYFGHGASSGDFSDGTIGRWTEDAVAVLDAVTAGPQVLVGSSMGGWIMVLAALARPERVAGLLGVAAAPDFTEDLIPLRLTADQKKALKRDGVVHLANDHGDEPTPVTRALIDDGSRHLVLRRSLALDLPVRLLHGMKDADVPWETSLRLARVLTAADVEITLVKDGDHRLSEPADLARLCAVLGGLLDGFIRPRPGSP